MGPVSEYHRILPCVSTDARHREAAARRATRQETAMGSAYDPEVKPICRAKVVRGELTVSHRVEAGIGYQPAETDQEPNLPNAALQSF
ncbi:hypothetical protein GCM10016455_30800 [Aliiroseovarius zhejiangensis]|uniref:Uncharacterized protein n=1 Tax=Aliiroseovarius zhejiangensis TaxID=1632025 RepID=A0ABQ3JAA0_9RHOB|nr:hypothetical protein GCM10016455_30800 [Aliiroseovarius zhejiangensis]